MIVGLGIAGGAVGAHVMESCCGAASAERMAMASNFAIWNGLGLILMTMLDVERLFLWALFVGILVFSGLLAAKSISPQIVDSLGLGRLIPFGGGLLIVIWLLLALRFLRPPRDF